MLQMKVKAKKKVQLEKIWFFFPSDDGKQPFKRFWNWKDYMVLNRFWEGFIKMKYFSRYNVLMSKSSIFFLSFKWANAFRIFFFIQMKATKTIFHTKLVIFFLLRWIKNAGWNSIGLQKVKMLQFHKCIKYIF